MPEPKRGQREGQGFVHCQDDRSVAVGDRCIITVLLSSRSSVALSLWAGEDKRLDDVSVCVCVCVWGGGVVVVMSSFLSLRLRVTPLLWYAFVSHTVRVVCCGFGNYSGVSAESNKFKF